MSVSLLTILVFVKVGLGTLFLFATFALKDARYDAASGFTLFLALLFFLVGLVSFFWVLGLRDHNESEAEKKATSTCGKFAVLNGSFDSDKYIYACANDNKLRTIKVDR